MIRRSYTLNTLAAKTHFRRCHLAILGGIEHQASISNFSNIDSAFQGPPFPLATSPTFDVSSESVIHNAPSHAPFKPSNQHILRIDPQPLLVHRRQVEQGPFIRELGTLLEILAVEVEQLR